MRPQHFTPTLPTPLRLSPTLLDIVFSPCLCWECPFCSPTIKSSEAQLRSLFLLLSPGVGGLFPPSLRCVVGIRGWVTTLSTLALLDGRDTISTSLSSVASTGPGTGQRGVWDAAGERNPQD